MKLFHREQLIRVTCSSAVRRWVEEYAFKCDNLKLNRQTCSWKWQNGMWMWATNCAAILMNFLMSWTLLLSSGHSSTSVITHNWTSLQRCSSSSSATVRLPPPPLPWWLEVKKTRSCCTNEVTNNQDLDSYNIGSIIMFTIGRNKTSCTEWKMAQSRLVRATATSHVFKVSMRAVLCCSSELSVNGFWRW